MIQILNLAKSYGKQILFENLSFTLNKGEKVGLVGRNGSGKTTLLRLILGLENYDEGSILIPKGYKIGYLKQHINFTQKTTLQEACLSIPQSETGTDETYKAKKALKGLGFLEDEFDINPTMLSGGFQIRLNLAKTLLEEPDLLLLDEPTNYLDIVSIRWLRQFLRAWAKELIIITHDRDFMDSVTTHTMTIHRNQLKKIEGNTHKLYEQIILEEQLHEQTRINDEKKRKEIQEFIDRFRAKATKARQVQSRIKALQRQENLEQLKKIKNLDFEFSYLKFHGKWLIDVKDIAFGYDTAKPNLIEGLSISINSDDRIAIIGKNGKGKSTLLNLLAGELIPTKGSVIHNPKLSLGYFGQTNVLRLDPHKTVTDEIMSVMPEDNVRKARTIAGIMMSVSYTHLTLP
ncbi:MAG: ATP-binding cassette domain-containing protein, partial [Thermodesulfovibrionales bacterium]|nr:ATP-binding cassette domain-containing protein [Thermodesulfovibrionales bacterium]